ncbi:MAG: hypothetical protein K6T65_13475 [Peptococcaceae bacterium]|nr:hypothetical protein [Peptococcaceae bacterium]
MILLEAVLFSSIFAAAYSLLASGERLSVAEATVDAVRSKVLEFIRKNRDNERIIDILKLDVEQLIKKGFLAGLMLGLTMLAVMVKFLGPFSALMVPLGIAVGILVVNNTISRSYKQWQEQVLGDAPVLADFLPAFLEIGGVSTRAALENTVPFLTGPLKEEMADAVAKIKDTGAAKNVFRELGERVGNATVSAVCARLSMAWDTTVTPDLFMDLSEEIGYARELSAARATTMKTLYFTLIALSGLFGLLFLAGYPALVSFKNMMSHMFGG